MVGKIKVYQSQHIIMIIIMLFFPNNNESDALDDSVDVGWLVWF